MTDEQLAAVDDGRVFTGRQGLPLKLIDQIGTEEDAVAWLESDKGVAKNLPIRDWKPDGRLNRLGLFGRAAAFADGFGYPALARVLAGGDALDASRSLDGLVSIWQGDRVE